MRITESQLRRIIRQEVRSLREAAMSETGEPLEVTIQTVIGFVHPSPTDVDYIIDSLESGNVAEAMATLTPILAAGEDIPDVADEASDVLYQLQSMLRDKPTQLMQVLRRVEEFSSPPDGPLAPPAAPFRPLDVAAWNASNALGDEIDAIAKKLLTILPRTTVLQAVRSPSNKQKAILAQAVRNAGYADLDDKMVDRVVRNIIIRGSRAAYKRGG